MEVNNNNYLTMNKVAMRQEVEANPSKYSSSLALFNNKETFIDKFTKFEAAADKEMAEIVKGRYQTALESMCEKILDANEIKKITSFLEVVADYVKNTI